MTHDEMKALVAEARMAAAGKSMTPIHAANLFGALASALEAAATKLDTITTIASESFTRNYALAMQIDDHICTLDHKDEMAVGDLLIAIFDAAMSAPAGREEDE